MRILMTTDTIGGVWRFSQELVAGLLDLGCDLTLVSLGRSPSEEQLAWVADITSRWPLAFSFVPTVFPLEWMQSNGSAFTDAAVLLSALAHNKKADVLHSNQLCFGALQLSIPIVVTAHSDVLSWAAACRARSLTRSAWLDHYCSLVSYGLLGADVVVAPTEWMLDALFRNCSFSSERRVISNGRSIRPRAAQSRSLQAVTAGRLWDEAKNVAMLASITTPMPILVAGENAGEMTTPPLTGITLMGVLSEAELLSLFSRSAIYLCTSKYEPFGLAPLEAALCGCAILANDIPSLREVWQDTAIYFTDTLSLEARLQQLAGDAGLLAQMQSLAQQRAQTFSRERMSEQYLSIFQMAVTRRSCEVAAHVA